MMTFVFITAVKLLCLNQWIVVHGFPARSQNEKVMGVLADSINLPLFNTRKAGYLEYKLSAILGDFADRSHDSSFSRWLKRVTFNSRAVAKQRRARLAKQPHFEEIPEAAAGLKVRKRYKLHRFKLGATNLTYKISLHSKHLPKTKVGEIISRGFETWANHSALTFTRVSDAEPADIVVKFVTGHHGDKVDFDGPGGYLAHSLFPEEGAEIHMDDDEYFTDEVPVGVSLYQVFVHELGHVLGLEHSDHDDAVMSAYYVGYKPNFHLTADDIAAIEALYETS